MNNNEHLKFANSTEEAKKLALKIIKEKDNTIESETYEGLLMKGRVLESDKDNFIKDALNKYIEYVIKEKKQLEDSYILKNGSIDNGINLLNVKLRKDEKITHTFTSFLPEIIRDKRY
ncbi:MAG: hypothetical protein II815_11355, partial [Bacteroidales bacterium]|nr:hypothetical protein [Bacteroidales bacterium]